MREANHIITFLARAKKFTNVHGITSILKVDSENCVQDVFDNSDTCGGLIAGMQNDIGEIVWILQDYYKSTGNKKMLKRLNKHFPNVK